MTLKHIRNNTSAENEEIVKNVALEQNGVLKVTKKNLFNYQSEENYETFDLKDIKLRIQKVSQDELNALALSEEEDDILLRETNIFLVNFGDEGDDEYKEFIWTIDGNGENGRFEQVGTTKLELDTKVDKEEGKGLFSDEEKAKLEGIAFGANYYVHPSTHPASMITDLETVATTGSYNDLKDKPTDISTFNNDVGYLVEDDISGKVNSADLATVATTGSYDDLTNKPTNVSDFTNDAGYLVESDISGKINTEDLATVATTGSYNDLEDKPTNISTFNNDAGYLVEDDISGKANSEDLATVATTGSYNDLEDKPTDISTFNNDAGYLTEDDIDINGQINTENLARVATTGSYNDLGDKPTDISTFNNDAGYLVEDDISGKANISDLGDVAFSNDYEDLDNKPSQNVFYGTCSTSSTAQTKVVTVNDWTFTTGNILFVQFTQVNNYDGTAKISIDGTTKDIARIGTTKTSQYLWREGELVGFVYDGTNMLMLEGGFASTTYYGITKLSNDIDSTSNTVSATSKAVKTAYDLADSKQDKLVSGTNIRTINGQTLLGDGNLSVGDVSTSDLGDVAFSNDYNQLTNKPTNVSDFTNDAGYLTEDPKGSFDELQQLIYGTEPGDKIILDKDYKNTGNEPGIDIDRDITIIGNGHDIDANSKSNIFTISADNISIQITDVSFLNGKITSSSSGAGGAISSSRSSAPIIINDCDFINNIADYHGGAIYSRYSPITIFNCNFYNNKALNFNGGAIYCLKTSSISNSYFINNVARSPGNDIYSTENGLIIYNCHNPSGLYNCVNKELKYEEFEITYDDNGEEETEIITFLVLDNS